ncbi:hypothetical protein [Clostridium butyricum]
MDIEINKTKEYTFDKVYNDLLTGRMIITSKNSGYSYRSEHKEEKIKLKFFNPVISIWQPSNYFSSEEILDKWYATQA